MRPKLLLLGAILAAALIAIWLDYSAQYAAPIAIKAGEKSVAPPFEFTAMDTGKTYRLADFKGKTILLNFWATWCPPCRKEFPELIELAEKHPDNFVLLLMSVDKAPQDALRFARNQGKKRGYPASEQLFEGRGNIRLGYDENRHLANKVYGTYRFPESYIINPDLTIRRKIVGPVTRLQLKRLEAELAN